jgi:phosphoenolpyruvate synthase/pyruvate phosphate dikinase
MPITEIVDKQMPSLTEWLEKAGFVETEEFRQEDNTKRDRLEILFQETGLEYDRPAKFKANDLKNKTAIFQNFLNKAKDEQCALRLLPTTPGLPKLRVRGKTLKENLIWFENQDIDAEQYKVEIVPHNDHCKYSATFLINDHGIIGEIIKGLHWQLTQGFHQNPPIYFSFDFHRWNFSKADNEAEKWAKQAVASLSIPLDKQKNIQKKIKAEFNSYGYLNGYFEFAVWPTDKILFFDYNRIIYKILKDVKPVTATNSQLELSGICANAGKATGTAKIVLDPAHTDFSDGDILICPMTMIDYVPLMKKASGIITEQGSILSHAAIVARELKKPCLVGVKGVLEKIKDGQNITLNANNGQIILN